MPPYVSTMILRPVKPAVGVRAAEHERPGRVDPHVEVVVGELGRDRRADDLVDEVGPDHGVAVDALLVLGADEHRLQRDRPAVLVLVGDLGLAVGTEVRDLPGLADLGQPLGEPVGGPDRQRQQVRRLVAGEAEHHALVAGALGVELVLAAGAAAQLLAGVDALGDVRALLVDRHDHAARRAVEPVQGVVVADLADRLAGQLGDVDVGLGGDLPGHDAQPRGQQRLAGHATVRVLGEDGVEDGVADLVGHLVGMALSDAL